MKNRIVLLSLLGLAFGAGQAQTYQLNSPDKTRGVEVTLADTLQFEMTCNGNSLGAPSKIYLQLDKGKSVGLAEKSARKREKQVKEEITAPFYRQELFTAAYNELDLKFKHGGVIFRAYDSGIAYRFYTTLKDTIEVLQEGATYNFPEETTSYLTHTNNAKQPFAICFQGTYKVKPLANAGTQIAYLPATMALANGVKVTLLESDLEQYPGMFVQSDTLTTTLKSLFAPYPASFEYYPWRQQKYVKRRHHYIARTQGSRAYPWRVFAITTDDREMPTNNLVYALASPSRIKDTSWIKPGKVAWDWWNDWGLTGVDFEAGINTQTYKHYIDFAAKYGLEYVVLDEGWYVPKSGDMLTVIPEIDLPELVRYGKAKGVDLVLWTVFNVLNEQLQEACRRYSSMGIKGFKVDFLDRDDQEGVEMTYRLAEACAQHKLILDYHGIYKPTGINRTYPNVVNYEGVFGMEEMKWSPKEVDMPLYNVTFPYIRMMAGFVDFTPGAMRNATQKDYQPIYSNPMSMGTRSHQAAMYIVHDSPFTMLCDAPTAYEADQPYTQFIASIPTCFEETRILQGKLGEYIVTARRQGKNWYVAGMTNWDAREVTLALDFLTEGQKYNVQLCKDGVNSHRNGCDYSFEMLTLQQNSTQTLKLAAGGGFAMILTQE